MHGRLHGPLERLQLLARQTLVLHDEGAIWFEDAWSKTPTHLRMRLAKSPRPTIMVESKAPYGIVAANRAWQEQCGYHSECLGQSPKILQGELTDMKKAARFRKELVATGMSSMTVTNYNKAGEAFLHKLHTFSVGDEYYFTEGTVVSRSNKMADLIVAWFISTALALCLFPLAPQFSCVQDPSTTMLASTSASSTSSDTNALCVCFLLAFSVAALNEALAESSSSVATISNAYDPSGLHRQSLGIALLVAMASVVLEPSMHPTGGLATGLFVGCLLFTLPREGHSNNVQTSVSALMPHLQERAHQPLAEILLVTFTCLLLVASPLAGSYLPMPESSWAFSGYPPMSENSWAFSGFVAIAPGMALTLP